MTSKEKTVTVRGRMTTNPQRKVAVAIGLETQTSETGDIDRVHQPFRKQASQSETRQHSATTGIAIAGEKKTSAVDLVCQHRGIRELHRIENQFP